MSTRHLLLVSPSFHGYWRSIAEAFTRRGYAVHTHLIDAETAWGKARHKLGRELPERLGRSHWIGDDATQRAALRLREVHPDVLLVVKGDTLEDDFWSEAQRIPRRGLWLYDELRRTRHTTTTLRAAGPIASYSPEDVAHLSAEGFTAVHLPLAHDPHVKVTPRPSHEVCFVGARYPARGHLLADLAAAGVPVRAHGRDWSSHPFDRLRTWRFGQPGLPAGRDLTRTDAYAVMAGSPAALNIHGDQDGFTMRTFEVPGVGGLELVDRADVSQHYDPGTEVAVFADPAEAIDLCRRAMADRTWSDSIRAAGRRRTLAEHTFDHRAEALESLWA